MFCFLNYIRIIDKSINYTVKPRDSRFQKLKRNIVKMMSASMKYFVINLIYMVFCQKKQRLQAYIMTSIFHTKQTTLNNATTDRFA